MPPSASVLFHPKKKPQAAIKHESLKPSGSQDSVSAPSAPGTPLVSSPTPNQPATPKRPRAPRPKPVTEDDATSAPPEGPFSEYRLLSSALNGWKYDVMKFDSRKPVDITTWSRPVKLNRKEARRDGRDGAMGAPVPQAVGPMLGPDGKPVIGMDGKVVMVDADGRPIRPGDQNGVNGASNGAGGAGAKGKDKEKVSAAKKKFQKKTKQVFLVPDAVRQLRKEERYPWVMEDGSGKEVWHGSMEEVSKAETQAMFMPAANDIFKFVPAHRWYKFQKKPNYHIPNLEEAESLMTQIQKNKDPERWLLRKRNGQGPSDATVAMFKSEREGSIVPSGSSLVHSASQSLGPGGRRLRMVDSGIDGLFGDDDEEGVDNKRRRKRQYGAEGDLDELDFEEGFADDEEKPDVEEADDEEAKELEERLKREYKTANKTREGYIDESDEEEDITQLTGAGKDMRKLMKKLEKNTAYDDSDDEKNPYASSEEEPEEEIPIAPQGPAIIPPEPKPGSRSTSQAPATQPGVAGTKTPSSSIALPTPKAEPGSRATSPVPMPGHGGHSVVAKRATSPKAPKLKPNGTSRAGSPLAGASRPTSPVGSPPGLSESLPAVQSPNVAGKPSNKRKAEEGGQAGAAKPKKRKAQPGAAVNGELEDWMLVEWLKQTPNASTRDCIQYFTPYLTTEEKKQNFTKLVKEVAQLKGGVLVLRNSYRGSVGPSSPAATAVAE
ncbi:hypothetical protein EW026_g5906 [Hermanssonia centrifuga]|uniref:Uncharacterized protein n=1 Tax=Hermanssonia centrifuga TaxID=98765 RepID=A0A4S4KH10_9APHY|nr:hypothetical protein EW026_g5906 [Hermanssonia centrifuga]